jgi:hypothetical protein
MTAGPRQEDGGGLRARRLLERQVSRRGLLTLSLMRGATIAVGQAPEPAAPSEAALAPEPTRPVPCGACGTYHRLGEACPVAARQQGLARGFGRAPSAARPAPEFATKEPEGGS